MIAVHPPSTVSAQGIYLSGIGPVNRSMGGAGTAAPLDAIGSLYWNPASISALPCNEVSFGMELMLPNIDLTTTIAGGSSTTNGEPGVTPIPSVGWVHHIEDTAVTVGLGLYGIAGFKNVMPADPTNPLLAARTRIRLRGNSSNRPDHVLCAQRPNFGWHRAYAFRRYVDARSFGAVGRQSRPTPGQGGRLHWGGGVQAGVYYIGDAGWHLGFTYKSRQYFEDFRFFTPGGVTKFDIDFPTILSLGLAYSAIDDWIFAADARYFDYANTPGFSNLGWSNIFAFALGAQYHMSERIYLRAGYNFNQDPMHSEDAAVNLLDPLIQSHNIATGLSYRFAKNVDLTMSYVYMVHNTLTGPLPAPFPAGSTVTHELDAHSVLMGVTVRY